MGNVDSCLDGCEQVKESSLSLPITDKQHKIRRFRPKWRHTTHHHEKELRNKPFPQSKDDSSSYRTTWHHGARWRGHRENTASRPLFGLNEDLERGCDTVREITNRTDLESHMHPSDDDEEEEQEHKKQQHVKEHPRRRRHPFTSLRKTSVKALSKTGHAVCHVIKACEDFLFPRSPLHDELIQKSSAVKHRRFQSVLLEGCESQEEHYELIQEIRQIVRDLHGSEGLRAMGLEYRSVPCDAHLKTSSDLEYGDEEEEADLEGGAFLPPQKCYLQQQQVPSLVPTSEITSSFRTTELSSLLEQGGVSSDTSETIPHSALLEPTSEDESCHFCQRRLFHISSNTLIDEDNRKKFIADGDMYEDVARLCQETAQDIMCEEANLEWVTVEDPVEGGHREPIRVLVSSEHPLAANANTVASTTESSERPTLLIATGRGKVRAGIFSRKHLMCDGLESATALPMALEASSRQMNVLIVDPNIHGEANGFTTFQTSLDFLFHRGLDNMYMLSHSASGGHLARYLLDRSQSLLSSIRGIAFTDSTHNIQWTKPQQPAKTKSASRAVQSSPAPDPKHDALNRMLQSERCVYFRCANPRDSQWYVHAAGDPVQTDTFWRHRFGNIRTLWAGTDEHSLTNWFAHAKIWEHFDELLLPTTNDHEEASSKNKDN